MQKVSKESENKELNDVTNSAVSGHPVSARLKEACVSGSEVRASTSGPNKVKGGRGNKQDRVSDISVPKSIDKTKIKSEDIMEGNSNFGCN